MRRITLLYALLFFCTGFASVAAPLSTTDSSRISFSGAPENYNFSLLNANPFQYERVLSPFQFDSIFVPVAGVFRFSHTAFDGHLSRPFYVPDRDTNFAASDLRILLGSTREQILFLDHAQRITRNLSATLHYHSIVSPGFLLNCLSVEKDFSAGLLFKPEWITSAIDFRYGKVDADENGGIPDSISVNGLSRADFERVKTLASDEKRIVRSYQLSWRNFIPLSHADSSRSKWGILANVDWHRWGTSYSGVAEKNLYNQFYIDSAATKDTCGVEEWRYGTGLKYESSFKGVHWHAVAGYNLHNDVNWRVLDSVAAMNFNDGFIALNLTSADIKMNVTATQVQSSGSNDNDFSLQGAAAWNTGGRILSAVSFQFKMSAVAPYLTDMYYRSNHFRWNNDFDKENYLYYSASASLLKNRFSFSVNSLTASDLVYFNAAAVPVQDGRTVHVQQAELKGDVSLKRWRLFVLGRSNTTDAQFLKIPDWSGLLRLSYTARYFKKALLAEFGASVYGTSAYKGYAYMPATSAFYVQNEWNCGGMPIMDVFVNAGIGKATLSLSWQRFSAGFISGEYYLAAGYPGAPPTIKFSVNWPLVN